MAAVQATRMALVSEFKAAPLKQTSCLKSKTAVVACKPRVSCVVEAFPVITISTALMLGAGRFGFNTYAKNSAAKQGQGVQNGKTHAEAGDERAVEVDLFTKTNDPEGFTLTDVLGWGALGHSLGFAILAIANNGYGF